MAIEYAGLTDVGMRRDHNEDNYAVDPDSNLFICCDGMGGHAAGEVASKIAVDTVASFILASSNDEDITWPFEYDEALSLNANRMRTAVRLANQNVINTIHDRTESAKAPGSMMWRLPAGSTRKSITWVWISTVVSPRLRTLKGRDKVSPGATLTTTRPGLTVTEVRAAAGIPTNMISKNPAVARVFIIGTKGSAGDHEFG